DQLTPEDWQELVDLRDLLEPMKTLTIRLQGNATTGSHGALWESLGAMELLLEKLETKKKQYEHLPNSHFKACIKLGWKKLEKYYQLTDESPVYRAAIFLHPRHKWTWFRKHWRKSHPDWIISAKIAVTALWQEYKQRDPPTFEQQQHHEPDLLDSFMDQDVEGDSDSEIEEQFLDEFERYAYEAVAQNERDPLRWWRDNAWRYPTLCRLAFDLLAVPAMSAECELPDRRWKDISMDFFTDLPESHGCTAILVVVDRLSKMRHYIACKSMDATELARVFLIHVWKLHGLPDSILSDRGMQFVSAFWRTLTARLGIQARLSTAYHPESDGQTENANASMEQYLRMYVSYQQDDWVDWLPMAEFVANNHMSETTNVSPFLANYGQHPRLGFEPRVSNEEHGSRGKAQVIEANAFVDKMKELEAHLRTEMKYAQAVYEEKSNQRRSPAPAYKVGDLVWLNGKNIKTTRPSKKLDWKWLGPYKVKRVVSPYAYQLESPRTVRVHDVFHTNLLRPATTDSIPGQRQLPPPPIIVDGEQEWQIEEVVDSRMNARLRRFEYRVRWTGYNDLTWEPIENVSEATAVDKYHQKYPGKPRP
ncbi:hypothetical protein B0A49_13253, partial [Cryomyces minteri]